MKSMSPIAGPSAIEGMKEAKSVMKALPATRRTQAEERDVAKDHAQVAWPDAFLGRPAGPEPSQFVGCVWAVSDGRCRAIS